MAKISCIECDVDRLPNTFYDYPYECGSAIDFSTNTIYIHNRAGSLAILHIKHNSDDNDLTIIEGLSKTGLGSTEIMIDNQFHVIGGVDNNKHFKYNKTTKKWDIMHIFKDIDKFCYPKTVRVRDKLLVFGGMDASIFGIKYVYDIKNNEWKTLQTIMPKAMSSFGCISILNHQYVLFVGGGNALDKYRDILFIGS